MHDNEIRKDAKTPAPSLGYSNSVRQSGRGALLEHARRLRIEADKYEALAMAIPENFPRDADEGLWNLVVTRTR